MIRSLLSARGSAVSMVTVFIDGFYQEPHDVAGLFGIRAIQVSQPLSVELAWQVNKHAVMYVVVPGASV